MIYCKKLLICLGILCLIYLITTIPIKKSENFDLLLPNHDNIKEKITYGLKTIDELFNANNIHYIIAYGTLLGAVRHWDMIPWDDDADIIVLRKDYNNIIKLKNDFKNKGLIMETDWKLIKIYFDDTKFPFIDIFIHDNENGKTIRCAKPFEKKCNYIDKVNDWWWRYIDYPYEWNINKKRFKFGNLELWGPVEAERILKYWYGPDCLTKCETNSLDHMSGNYVEKKNITCRDLPKKQI